MRLLLLPPTYHVVVNRQPSCTQLLMFISHQNTIHHACFTFMPCVWRLQNKCPVGSYCPDGTASGASSDVRCPRKTTSLVGASELLECIIEAVSVNTCYSSSYRNNCLCTPPQVTLVGGRRIVFNVLSLILELTHEIGL